VNAVNAVDGGAAFGVQEDFGAGERLKSG